jgi:sigma-B regulation protein RsbU (phosphoserine phosphatase)
MVLKASPLVMRFLLAIYVIASLLYFVPGMLDQWNYVRHPGQQVRAPFDYDYDTRVITNVEQEGEAAGIPSGSRLASLNGVNYTGRAQWESVLDPAEPGETVEIGYVRLDGTPGTATVTLRPLKLLFPAMGSTGFTVQMVLLSFVMPLVCIVIGAWVVALKPLESNAWLALLLLTFPEVVFLQPGNAYGGWLLFRGLWYHTFQYIGAPALLLFGVYFPERSRLDARARWVKWLILLALLGTGVIIFLDLYREYYAGGNTPAFIRLEAQVEPITNFLNLLCVILYIVLVLDKLRSASTADARRRLRVLSVGTGTGMAALLITFVLLPRLGLDTHNGQHLWIKYTGASLFMVAPLSLGYVVLVQRALDVRILLRTGTRYMMARVTLFAMQAAVFGVIGYRLLFHPAGTDQSTFARLAGPILFAALILVFRSKLRKPIQDWVDRRFFREAYDSERVLSELSDEVRKFTEAEPLLETVTRQVAETLHVKQIGMLLRAHDGFELKQAMGVPMNGRVILRSSSSTIRNLANTNSPAKLYREDPDAWYLMADDLEREALDALNAELLLPLAGRNRLMGVMALGPKRSEAAYSRSDLSLLQTVAGQTGLALEVSELAHSLAAEAAQRERVNREIEIAREVQERLFPQQMPRLENASVAGACRPAQGVGGDYYDVIPLEDGRIGLAIGDVSGKGISAALLMASLRASLRGVTLDGPRDFAKLMHKVNRLVYEASASNRYATFFFAAYDPVTCKLDCVNAGHNPPFVLRKNGAGTQVLRLEADGPVVGLLLDAPYTEQTLTLEEGDLFVAYTDGISEAMTRHDEEWGEERMIAAAEAVADRPADAVLRAVFAAADKFTAGAAQHDDMTMLILKLHVCGPQGSAAPRLH